MPPLAPTYARSDLSFARGEGAYLFTVAGERYLDFASGVAVTALGHAHPHLVRTLSEQAKKLWHVSNLHRIPEQERLAERLCAATFADMAFFANSGAEAVECAIKAARRYHFKSGAPERYRLVTFEGAFHGRTLATVAAGGQAKHLEGFGPAVDGFDQVAGFDLAAVEKAIGASTAGILIEPIMGEGGMREVPTRFLQDLRALADANGILLLLDEVQSGMGRTGRLFAHQWAGIRPDIMATAKGLGGGFPVGACLMTEAVGSALTAGS
ncbi:MAG: acetylornithine transaminase, partial [Methyloceanibacter sp.]